MLRTKVGHCTISKLIKAQTKWDIKNNNTGQQIRFVSESLEHCVMLCKANKIGFY